MKPSFYLLLIALAHFFLVSTNVCGQSVITPDNPLYDKLKAEGKLPDKKGRFSKPSLFTESTNPPINTQVSPPFFKACKELIPIDSTFSVVPFLAGTLGPPPLYRNDDASTQKITIPFNFCFYGNSFNQLYINNNGNISFDGPQVTYRPDSFPTVDFMAVSAFWADVDTRNFNSGVVYYKIEPSYMIVTWDHVGYYNSHADKKNTFQLIITDGTDTSLISPGKNVGFRYDQMEWTTGDIGGSNGFSLITNHATVGANKSDSVNFVQFGRFGIAGDAYDGPYAGTDGVSWLNGRVFEFSACSGSNIEPIVNNFNYCDTIYSCVGDTNLFDLSFLSPERNQITSTVITTTATSGLTVIQNTPGDVNTIKAQFIGEFANVGYQHISFIATDSGPIPASSALDIVVKVDQLNIPLTIAGGGINICPGTTTPLTATTGFEKYYWSNNSITNPANVQAGTYYVTGKIGKCYLRSDTVQVHENITTIPVISGSLFACPDDSTLLSVNPSFSSYLWSSGDTTNPVALPAGNYFVNTIDSNACNTQSATITILNHSVSVPSISGDTICCTNDSIVLTASAGFTAYSWSNGSNFSSATLPPGNYVVSVGDANNCLTKSAGFTVSSYPFTLPTTSGTSNFCFGDSVLWTINPAYPHYLWSSGDTIQNTFLQSGTHYAIVQDAYNCTFKSSIFTLQNYPAQSPTILGKNYLCNNDSLLLLAPSGFSQIQWSTGATSNSIFAQNGNYTLTGRDSNNCLSISLPHSVVISQPVVNIVGAQTICDQDSTSLSLSLTFTDYNWSNGSQNASVWVRDGNYSVEIHDSIGCKGSASIVIASYFLPTAFFIHEPPVAEINEPIQFFNASQGNGDTVISYTWTLSNNALVSNLPNPILVFDEEGNKVITLTVTTNNGCIDSYSETIEVIKSIKIPNIITPNGDGLNDIFEIVNLDLSKSNRLVVFDRWGKLVYSSNKYQNDWNAEKLDDGVYYFTLQIEGNKELKGSLTVLH